MEISIIRRCLGTLCCLGGMAIATAQKPADKANKLEKLNAVLSAVLQEEHGAGYAIAVVEKDKVIFSKGFGYRDITHKLPVTPHTQFAIGSCTKAFTSTLLGNLRKAGKVDFDKPATTYLPSLDFSDPALNYQVTLRDMMCHRTGFSRYDLAWALFNTSSRDTLLQRMHYMKPTAPLRARWQYNNFMFMVQGMVAEKLTGQSWEQNINSQILQPLGMSESSIGTIALAAAPEPSRGYSLDKDAEIKDVKYHPIVAMGPAGAINSTVMDMSKWLITWMHGGMYNNKEIIPADYAKEATSSQMVMDGGAPDPQRPDIQFGNYGFGWMVYSYRSHYRVEHGGNVDGSTALTTFYPLDSIGIVVLSNQTNSKIPAKVVDIVSNELFGIASRAKKNHPSGGKDTSKPYVDPDFKAHTSTHPVTAFVGDFKNDAYGTLHIYNRADSLFVGLPDITWLLVHEDYDIYSPYDATDSVIDPAYKSNMRLQFLMSNAGDIDRVSFAYDPYGDPVIFDKQLTNAILTAASLKELAGTYNVSGTPITISTGAGNVLELTFPGQPKFTLEAIDNSNFRLKELKDYKVKFVRDAGQQVIALTFIQPNGSFRADREKKK